MNTKRTLLAGIAGLFITGFAAFAGPDAWKAAPAQSAKGSCCAAAKACCVQKLACCSHDHAADQTAGSHGAHAGTAASAPGAGCCAAKPATTPKARGCCAH